MLSVYKLFNFAQFTLNAVKRTLFRGDTEILMSGRDFDVLLFLVENAPQICSFDEIIDSVWQDVKVSNNSVEKVVVNLRKALSNDPRKPQFIRTVRNKGYSFICDVREVEERKTPAVEEKSLPKGVDVFHQPQNTKVSSGVGVASYFVAPILLLLIGFLWWKGGDILSRFTATTVFADDFSGSEVDATRWLTQGNSVKIAGGILKLTTDETDKPGNIYSKYFTIDPAKVVSIKSRIKVAFSRNMKNETYFGGRFVIVPKTDELEKLEIIKSGSVANKIFFGVRYMNYDSKQTFTGDFGEPVQEIPTEGFFLVRDGGRPNVKPDYAEGKISERIEPIWDRWFEQKIIYDPVNGQMTYFVDGEKRGEFNVGKLQAKDNQIRLEISPWGWWVNHSTEIDDIEVSQF